MLHNDIKAFEDYIEEIAERTGIREDVLEKDYYVTLFLKELSEKQQTGLKAYFRGGTALYKALKQMRRFSEDIDLTVNTQELSRTQSAKTLKEASKRYQTLPLIEDKGVTNRSEIIAYYDYSPVTEVDMNDSLERFGKVMVEATSFTISEPIEEIMVSSLIYDNATAEQQKVLEEVYGMGLFPVQTITLERAFIDKLFAAEAYIRRSEDPTRCVECGKHLYDLHVLLGEERIQDLLRDAAAVRHLVAIRFEEEKGRHGGIPYVLPSEFELFTTAAGNSNLAAGYERMQRIYVFDDRDRVELSEALDSLQKIEQTLKENEGWIRFDYPTIEDKIAAKQQKLEIKREMETKKSEFER